MEYRSPDDVAEAEFIQHMRRVDRDLANNELFSAIRKLADEELIIREANRIENKLDGVDIHTLEPTC